MRDESNATSGRLGFGCEGEGRGLPLIYEGGGRELLPSWATSR